MEGRFDKFYIHNVPLKDIRIFTRMSVKYKVDIHEDGDNLMADIAMYIDIDEVWDEKDPRKRSPGNIIMFKGTVVGDRTILLRNVLFFLFSNYGRYIHKVNHQQTMLMLEMLGKDVKTVIRDYIGLIVVAKHFTTVLKAGGKIIEAVKKYLEEKGVEKEVLIANYREAFVIYEPVIAFMQMRDMNMKMTEEYMKRFEMALQALEYLQNNLQSHVGDAGDVNGIYG